MTVLDLHTAFKVNMDKNAQGIAFGGCPAFLPEEIDMFLNEAYIQVIHNKYTCSNTIQTAFEQSIKRIADLQKLVVTDSGISLVYPDPNSNVLLLNNFSNGKNNTLRMLYVDCVLHFGNSSATCTLIDHTTAKQFLKTYNNDPWVDTPKAVLKDDTLKIFIDSHKMVANSYTADLTFIKYPTKIDYTEYNKEITDVPDYVLNEVVDRAVTIALENIESGRSQSKLTINTLSE